MSRLLPAQTCGGARVRSGTASLALLLLLGAGAAPASADADGPDFWGLRADATPDELTMRVRPDLESPVLKHIPEDAEPLRNLGCTGVPSFAEWLDMSDSERRAAAEARWCRVRYQDVEGWVPGRALIEAPGSQIDP